MNTQGQLVMGMGLFSTEGSGSPPVTNHYITEDGSSNYVTEDGLNNYVTE